MQKIIRFISLIIVITTGPCSAIGCSFFNGGGDIPNPNPAKKTINDYNKDIEVKDNEIQKIKNEIITQDIPDKDWKEYIVNGEKGTIEKYRAQIKDDRYQILLLEYNNQLSPAAIKKAQKILKRELTALKKEISFFSDKSLHGDGLNQVKMAKEQQDIVNKELKLYQ